MDRLKPFYLPLLFGIVLLVSFYRISSVSLFDVDEAVFSEATKEMVMSGNWITPTYDGANRYDKPILFYWLMAASYKVFGINELGARFPSALAAALLALAFFFFVRKVMGERTAFHAAMAFTLSLYFFVYSHAAVTDMVLTLFITLSLLSFFLASLEGEKRRLYLYGFYLFSALAFLTKGLIGIVFPFGIALAYLFATERTRGLKKVFDARGTILFILVSAPWYAAEIAANGREFLMQFFVKHHFERYLDVISGHRGPVYYYVPVLIVGLLPWVAFLPAGMRNVFRDYRHIKENGAVGQKKSRLELFAFVWFALIFLFFSFSTTKLPNYILSAIPAALILIASGMTDQDARWRKISQGIAAVLALVAGVVFILSKKYLLRAGIADAGWTTGAAIILFGISVLSICALLLKKPLHLFVEGAMLAFLLLLSVTALPAASDYLQAPLHRFSMYAREHLGSGERIIAYRANNPSIVFYSGHRVIYAGGENELASLLRRGAAKMVIAKTKDPETLEKLGLEVLDKGGEYALFEKK